MRVYPTVGSSHGEEPHREERPFHDQGESRHLCVPTKIKKNQPLCFMTQQLCFKTQWLGSAIFAHNKPCFKTQWLCAAILKHSQAVITLRGGLYPLPFQEFAAIHEGKLCLKHARCGLKCNTNTNVVY